MYFQNIKAIGWGSGVGHGFFWNFHMWKFLWFLAQRFLRNRKIRIFREMAAIWNFQDLPIFYIKLYGKMGQNRGSWGKSNGPYLQAKMTFKVLNLAQTN